MHVLGLRGLASAAVNRGLMKGADKQLTGEPCREARYLGPIMRATGNLNTELTARIVQAKKAWCSVTLQVWHSPMSRKLLRMFFIAFVQGTPLSGLTAWVLSDAAIRRLDTCMIRLPRCLMKGKACTWRGDEADKMTDEQVLDYWQMVGCRMELGVRRLKWYQRWATRPEEFSQVLAVVFATTDVEKRKGVRRVEEGGGYSSRSTPWALQLSNDFECLGRLEEGSEWHEQIKHNPLNAFKDEEMRERLGGFDMSALRTASWSSEGPPPGYRAARQDGSSDDEEGEQHGPHYECRLEKIEDASACGDKK